MRRPDFATAMFVACWEFRAFPQAMAGFAAAYGPDGEWIHLMRQAPGFLGSETLQDLQQPRRFLVLDKWNDADSFRRFRSMHSAAYAALDQRCLAFTESEQKVGHFQPWDGEPPAAPLK